MASKYPDLEKEDEFIEKIDQLKDLAHSYISDLNKIVTQIDERMNYSLYSIKKRHIDLKDILKNLQQEKVLIQQKFQDELNNKELAKLGKILLTIDQKLKTVSEKVDNDKPENLTLIWDQNLMELMKNLGLVKIAADIPEKTRERIQSPIPGPRRIHLYKQIKAPIFSSCNRGSALGMLNSPLGVAICSETKSFFVCDKENHRVQVFDHNLAFSWAIDENNSSNLRNPISICIHSQYIFIIHTSPDLVTKFDMNGKYMNRNKSHLLEYPTGICADANNIYVCSNNKKVIIAFDHNLMKSQEFCSHSSLKDPQDIKIFKQEELIVLNWGSSHLFLFFDLKGHLIRKIVDRTCLSNPRFFDIDPEGRIFVADYKKRISIFNAEGERLYDVGESFPLTKLTKPKGIALLLKDGCVNVVTVCDRPTDQLQVW